MNADDQVGEVSMGGGKLTHEQIRRHMLGLSTAAEMLAFEYQLAVEPAVTDAAKEVLPDDFFIKVQRAYGAWR